jgi:hypothetical protein
VTDITAMSDAIAQNVIPTHCQRCHRPFSDFRSPGDAGTGYGTMPSGEIICYGCCADEDRKGMRETGKAVLYLTDHEVTNWPGTLRFPVLERRRSYHNMAGRNGRTDVWFKDEQGNRWHGVNIGDSQVLRCRRVAR